MNSNGTLAAQRMPEKEMLEKINSPLLSSREDAYQQAYETSSALLEVTIAVTLCVLLLCTQKGRRELMKHLADLAGF